jgi:predicted ATPase
VQVAQDGSTVDILPIAAVLGANASGKSNLLKAMAFMREMVLESASRSRRAGPVGDPFLLDPKYADQPTLMELDFALDGTRYQYGFELLRGQFVEEWLQTYPHKRSQSLFDRERSTEFTFGKGLTGHNRTIAEITRPDVLFLSAAAQAGHPILTPIYQFFENSLVLLEVTQRSEVTGPTLRRLAQRRGKALRLLTMADLGIVDAWVREADLSTAERQAFREMLEKEFPNDMPEEAKEAEVERLLTRYLEPRRTVELVHRSRRQGTPMPFAEESLGTKSWLNFVSYALDALERGGALLVDELDASLHPILVAEAMHLFQSNNENKLGAQLIFTTHDVTLLDNSFERFKLSRGQIWLTEKGDDGASTLTPLSDYRPRKGEDLARGYLQGRYGGTPRLPPRITANTPFWEHATRSSDAGGTYLQGSLSGEA